MGKNNNVLKLLLQLHSLVVGKKPINRTIKGYKPTKVVSDYKHSGGLPQIIAYNAQFLL